MTLAADSPARRIMAEVRRIPRGRVSFYGAVAKAAGLVNGARQVARALRTGVDLPWWRVLGAGGVIRLPGAAGQEQAMRLRGEGIEVRGKRVDLKKFGAPVLKRASDSGPVDLRRKFPER